MPRDLLFKDWPRFYLAYGVEKAAKKAIEDYQQNGRALVLVAGDSGTRKSSQVAAGIEAAAKRLAPEADCRVFAGSDWYCGRDHVEVEANRGHILYWDRWEADALRLCRGQLEDLLDGWTIVKDMYDDVSGKRLGTENVDPPDIIIAEGPFLLSDPFLGLRAVRVLVNIGVHGRMIRRLMKNVYQVGWKPKKIFHHFLETVDPMLEANIQSTIRNADLIIDNLCPEIIEPARSSLHRHEQKFRVNVDFEMLGRLGADLIMSSVPQIDRYFSPPDSDFAATGEILRIREEGDGVIFAYKGPKNNGSRPGNAPVFEFEIEPGDIGLFRYRVGMETTTVKKRRKLFFLDGIVFAVDQDVTKIENGQETKLGDFIEIRAGDNLGDESSLVALLDKLGLRLEDKITELYANM